MDFPLIGPTISLRDWHESDFPELARWLQPGQRWKELDAPYYPLPAADELAAMIEHKRQSLTASPPQPRHEAVIAENTSDTLLGMVSWAWESQVTNWIVVGIAIYDPAWWGRGIGTQALGLWSEYLFEMLPTIVRLDLRTWSGNQGMQRLAEKLGYQLEARFRKARIVNGVHYDGLGYGVLREEWRVRYPNGFRQTLG